MSRTRIQRLRRQRQKRRLLRCIILAVLYVILLILAVCPRAYNITHYITYEVGTGETLWSIARAAYGDTVDIRDMIDYISYINGIEGGRIYAGQALSLPMSEE